MSDKRIANIQKAMNNEQLDKAMDGYASEASTAHPALQKNVDFGASMETGQFLRALVARSACARRR